MRKLSGKTRVHVLIGAPIAQVLAPGWLTDRMQKADYDGVLLAPLHAETRSRDRVADIEGNAEHRQHPDHAPAQVRSLEAL